MSSQISFRPARSSKITDLIIISADEIQRHSSLLEDAQQEIRILQRKVKKLEGNTVDQQRELDLAHMELAVHKRVIRKILGPHSHINLEEQYDSSESETESVQQTPC